MTHFNLRQVIGRIQRIIALSLRLELDDLRGGTSDIAGLQVCLILVEANVEGAGAGPINVPVRVDELRLVHLLRAVQFRRST